MKIFVYGATGQIGSIIIKRLLEEGHEVLAGTREPEEQDQKVGLTWIKVDVEKPGLGLESLINADCAFLMSPPFYADQYAVLNPWIEEAKKVNLGKVVLMSSMGVDMAPPEMPFRKLELSLKESGIDYNIIRPNWFMENFHTFWIKGILENKQIFFPGGQAKTSFVDIHDVAEVAFVLLQSGNYSKKEFTLTGRESLTHIEVANILSEATGVQIGYSDIASKDFNTGLIGAGIPEDYANLLTMLANNLAEGNNARITSTVKELTGRDPVRFASYASTNKNAWLKA